MNRRAAVAAAAVGIVALASVPLGGAAGRLPTCGLDQVLIARTEGMSEKTQQHTTAFLLANVSSRTCRLDGYPSLALLDGRGRALSFVYPRRSDQMITAARPVEVRLAPRQSAFFAFNKNVCVGHTNRYARTLRVVLPGGQSRWTVDLGPRAVDYCGGGDPGHVITVSPVESRFSGAFCLSQGPCRRR